MSVEYPESRRDEHVVDDLHGHRIADPYRWLEDADAAETVDWVRRQNEVTEAQLDSLPGRDWFQRTMSSIVLRPRAGTPARHSGWYFVTRNDGRQPQDVLYVAGSLAELLQSGRVLLDPNTFSSDGTDSLASFTVSGDGRYLAYGINESGSDWTTFRLLEVTTGAELDDRVTGTKFCEAVWLPDSSSYLYLYYPASGRSEGTETKALTGGRLMLHRVGTPQAEDQLILHFPANDQLLMTVELSHDDRYVVAHIAEGTDYRSRLWLYPVETTDGRSQLGEPRRVIDEPLHDTTFVRTDGDRLILKTDQDASRGRLVSSDLDGKFTELIPEGEGALLDVAAAGEGLVSVSLLDAQPVIELHGIDGKTRRTVEVDGGAVVGLSAEVGQDEIFLGMSSVTQPTAAYLISASSAAVRALPELITGAWGARAESAEDGGSSGSGRSESGAAGSGLSASGLSGAGSGGSGSSGVGSGGSGLSESGAAGSGLSGVGSGRSGSSGVGSASVGAGAPATDLAAAATAGSPVTGSAVTGSGGAVGFSAPEVTVTRRTAPGRQVPYFLISRADLDHTEPRPTLLYGYGGFKIPVLADYRPGWPAWLAAGGVLVIANLRGGGEYGSDWHEAGRLKNKQNVFDDFIAVAEHLQETKVTTAQQLAIHGRSNGGLLVGAVMTQRPDLFAAALPGVGVMDMLRFHLFTVGAAWSSDFGTPEEPQQFEDLLAYSPLHNLREGTAYPATLVLTGDHDDRVVPLHSHKFIATLQHVQAGEAPVLTRVEVDTGHGFGKPTAMVASEWADLLAFAAHRTHLTPPPNPAP